MILCVSRLLSRESAPRQRAAGKTDSGIMWHYLLFLVHWTAFCLSKNDAYSDSFQRFCFSFLCPFLHPSMSLQVRPPRTVQRFCILLCIGSHPSGQRHQQGNVVCKQIGFVQNGARRLAMMYIIRYYSTVSSMIPFVSRLLSRESAPRQRAQAKRYWYYLVFLAGTLESVLSF